MKKHIIVIAFIVGGLVTLSVLLYPILADLVNSRSQSRVVSQYIEDTRAIGDGDRLELLEAARAYNKRLLDKPDRFHFSRADTAEYLKQLDAGREVMGILAIGKINVSLPIYHGTDEGVLQIGLGHIQGTSLPVGGTGTHAFISGHRGLPSSKLLSNLDKMAVGDTFTLYILGETLTYQVDNIQTVLPEEVGVLDIDRDMDYCTLVTCTPYGVNTHRLLVRGHRVENAATGWDPGFGARRLDKLLILLLFLVPALPVFLGYAIVKCVKIHKKGEMYL